MAIDIDHRVTKQQYTPLLPLNGIEGGRKTSCMACQKKKSMGGVEAVRPEKNRQMSIKVAQK